MDEILLHGMRFHALIGVLPHERAAAQPLEIDLRVRLRAGDGVVDYRGLYDAAAAVVGQGHIEYLEEVGERVADRVLALSDRVDSVRVVVRKPHVRLPGPLDYAGVVIERGRA